MYVCFCEKINEAAIAKAVAAGARTPADVYNACGSKKKTRCDTCPSRVAAAMFPSVPPVVTQSAIAIIPAKP